MNTGLFSIAQTALAHLCAKKKELATFSSSIIFLRQRAKMSFFGFWPDTAPLIDKNDGMKKEVEAISPETPVIEEEVVKDEQKDEKEELNETPDENRAPAADSVDEQYASIETPIQENEEPIEVEPTEEKEALIETVEVETEETAIEASLASPLSRLECDYDLDPTQLYESLQLRNWEAAVDRCKEHEKEARTWVSRKERDGKLRWRLLPLHAAVIFKAPEFVIEALLAAYPKATECKDDQGMLPLHLAFRSGSSEGVVTFLLTANPQSINVKDRKGRIPLVLAQASTSPNRDAFMTALERGPTYYAVAAAATERAAVTAEQQALFDVKLQEINEVHAQNTEMLRLDYEQQVMDRDERIAELESDLAKTKETSQVLVDHVNVLEAQLSSRTDTERFLATRIATLDTSLKVTTRDKEDVETTLTQVNTTLFADKERLQRELETLQEDHLALQVALREAQASVAKMEEKHKEEGNSREVALQSLEREWASAKASEAILQAQLKKRIQSEHGLAKEVSFLAARLSESARESSQSVDVYGNRVRNIENERNELRSTVKALTLKLEKVRRQLDSVLASQVKLVEAAGIHDENMAEVTSIQAQLLEHTKRHHELFDKTQQEHQDMLTTLEAQREAAQTHSKERESILLAFEMQHEQMQFSQKERKQLVAKVEQQRLGIKHLIVHDLMGMPSFGDEGEDDLVDAVVKHVLTEDLVSDTWKSAASHDLKYGGSEEETVEVAESGVVVEKETTTSPEEVAIAEEAAVSEEPAVLLEDAAPEVPAASDKVVQENSGTETEEQRVALVIKQALDALHATKKGTLDPPASEETDHKSLGQSS
jgi:ankyrin repeat protein